MPSTATKQELYSSGFPKQMNRTKFNLPINKKLKAARKNKGYSLAKVVELLKDRGLKTGVSTIQGYEQPEDNMNHRYPPLHTLMLLIDLYSVPQTSFSTFQTSWKDPRMIYIKN